MLIFDAITYQDWVNEHGDRGGLVAGNWSKTRFFIS